VEKKFAAWLQFAKSLPPTNFPPGNFSNQFESFGAIWKVIESKTDQTKEKLERKKEQSSTC
jgi:hypothetical protein